MSERETSFETSFWYFTAVHRDGDRKRAPSDYMISGHVCAVALREAMEAGAALEIERVP